MTHQYLQDGNDSISVTVADDHATTAAVTTPVTVNNVAPSSVAINVSAATINENGSTTLSGSFVDPGTLDTHVVTINWGDGSVPQTVNLAAGVSTFSGVRTSTCKTATTPSASPSPTITRPPPP